MMERRADLHMHTTYSDGVLSPSELVHRAKKAGLHIISITDHDNVVAVTHASETAAEVGIDLIPGVELSAQLEGREVHILGYFIDVENTQMNQFLVLLREERLLRATRMVEKLNALNVPVHMDRVLEYAGEGSVGRPHIANAILDAGYAGTYQEVFTRYIGFGGPAYVDKFHCSPSEVISMISQAGGLSFLAHPNNAIPERVLLFLIKAGLDGIETVHPSHSPETTLYYRGIAQEYFLLESGGSDYHGGRKNDDAYLGRNFVPLTTVDAMRRRLFVQQK